MWGKKKAWIHGTLWAGWNICSSPGIVTLEREIKGKTIDTSCQEGFTVVTQIISFYTCGEQKSISEHAIHQTLKWLGGNT